MEDLAWNCRGVAKPPFGCYSEAIIRQYKYDPCFFFETRPFEQALPRIHIFMGFLWDVNLYGPDEGLVRRHYCYFEKGAGVCSFTHIDGWGAFSLITALNAPRWF